MKTIRIGSLVALNNLAETIWWEVLAIDGRILTIKEHGKNHRAHDIDKSLVKQVR